MANHSNDGKKAAAAATAPTAYDLFAQENFEMIKRTHGGGDDDDDDNDMSPSDIMSLVAQQWAQTSEAEKQMWNYRAFQLSQAEQHQHQHGAAVEDELAAGGALAGESEGGNGKRRATRRRGTAQSLAAETPSVSV